MKKAFSIMTALIFFCAQLLANNPSGNALSFDGNDDYVDCGNDAPLNINDKITLEAWIFSPTLNYSKIISKWGYNSGYELSIVTLAPFYDRELTLSLNQRNLIHYTLAGLENQWIHVAATWDGTNINLFVNGNLVKSLYHTDQIVNSTYNLILGRIANLSPSNSFDGVIDEIRIWKVARTQSQIQATMKDTLCSVYYSSPDSGLVAYWRFDEANGDTTFDMTSNHNDGIVHGATFVSSDAPLPVNPSHNSTLPLEAQLAQNFPNPFNPETMIEYQLPQKSAVLLTIHNILGMEIRRLVHEIKSAGHYSALWDGKDESGKLAASGMYLYRIEIKSGQQSFIDFRKMSLVR